MLVSSEKRPPGDLPVLGIGSGQKIHDLGDQGLISGGAEIFSEDLGCVQWGAHLQYDLF